MEVLGLPLRMFFLIELRCACPYLTTLVCSSQYCYQVLTFVSYRACCSGSSNWTACCIAAGIRCEAWSSVCTFTRTQPYVNPKARPKSTGGTRHVSVRLRNHVMHSEAVFQKASGTISSRGSRFAIISTRQQVPSPLTPDRGVDR